jgi:hypothetical protein
LNGRFRVPTSRNVDKRPRPDFVKAYGHNGYFESLKEIVHFYNTRDVLPKWCGRGKGLVLAVAGDSAKPQSVWCFGGVVGFAIGGPIVPALALLSSRTVGSNPSVSANPLFADTRLRSPVTT